MPEARRFVVAVLLSALPVAIVGCFGSSNDNTIPPVGDDGAAEDGALLEIDSPTGAPNPVVDSGHDATVSREAGVDATVALEGAAEASVEASVAETSVGEGSADAMAEEAAVVDAASAEAAPDASDVQASCIVAIFGSHYVAADGTLVYGGGGAPLEIVQAASGAPLTNITEVVQQQDHACGLRSDGTVWCWPLFSSGNSAGDLGNGTVGGTLPANGAATQVVTNAADAGAPAYLAGVVHLSTASDTEYTFPTCAIRSDRTVWCWGASTAGGSPPGGLFWGTIGSENSVPYAIPIAAGPSDGGPAPIATADQVSVGYRHVCLLSNGIVSCWGANAAGNLANGDATLAFQPYPAPIIPANGLPATVDAIGSGLDFSCALAGGSVWCWGSSQVGVGQIGNPSIAPSICNSNYCYPQPTPVQMSLPDGGSSQVADGGSDQDPLVGAAQLLVGYQFACVLTTSNGIMCWGANAATEAVPYTSTMAPYTDVTMLSAWGEDTTSLIYTTASGAYVRQNSVVTPYCP